MDIKDDSIDFGNNCFFFFLVSSEQVQKSFSSSHFWLHICSFKFFNVHKYE